MNYFSMKENRNAIILTLFSSHCFLTTQLEYNHTPICQYVVHLRYVANPYSLNADPDPAPYKKYGFGSDPFDK